jgi:predicted phosphate transport protein (TIGR00153 family)
MLIFKKEKHVRKLVLAHLAEVEGCLQATRNVLEEYLKGDIEAARQLAHQVIEIESRADKLEREIREKLLEGAFLPQIRSDVYRLVEAVDAIAGKAEDVARFIRAQRPNIPSAYESDLLELFRQSLNCFQELRKALRDYFKPKGKIENLHGHVSQVSELETQVDALEAELAVRLFDSDLELSEKIHLEQLIKRIADLADLSEDASDELEYAAMKTVI